MMKKFFYGVCLAVCCVACGEEEPISNYHRVLAEFEEQLGGDIDPSQFWKTAVRLKVNVSTTLPTDVVAYSSQDNWLYCRKEIDRDGTVVMTIPQGLGNQVLLVGNNGQRRLLKSVMLSGVPEQEVELVMPSPQVSSIQTEGRAAFSAALNGSDITPNIGYRNLQPQTMLPLLESINEAVDAAESGLEVNYELVSHGPFEVTMFYGFTGCYQSRILGYYYHSPGTYSDLKFVDLVDTHSFDYINGQAKIQYQLDGVTSQWYDSNFDYQDGFEPPWTKISDRLGDDVYNIEHVIRKYGMNRITALRGLSYLIDVPEEYRIGFYLKMQGVESTAQRASIVGKGIASAVLPDPFYETNFTAKALNKDGKHRSFLLKEEAFTVMGMEDASSSGDFDCNDVIFGLEAEVESEMPTLTVPDIDDNNGDNILNLPWTIAYEDVARQADFDFNDVVIRIVPDYVKEKATVTLLAAGSDRHTKMYLHYDGPEGDLNFGEVHDLLGGGDYINTKSAVAAVPGVELETVAWPKAYTVGTDANRFYVEVVRGDCTDCSDLITLSDVPGVLPQAICVVGEWQWPKEGVHISTAYPNFIRWAKDVSQQKYWGWHLSPQEDFTVVY